MTQFEFFMPAASAESLTLQVSASVLRNVSSFPLVQSRLDLLQALGVFPPTIVSSFNFAPSLPTRTLHK